MEEKILKELKAINVKLQETEEKITATMRKEIQETEEKITATMRKEIQETEEKITTTMREEIQEAKEKITATLRKEMNQRIGQSTTEISNEIKDLCEVIEKKENKNKDDMKKDLRQHENKVLKGVEALKKVLAS